MKRLMVILASPLLGALTLCSSESRQGTQTSRLSWQRTDDSLALLQDGRLVWRFNAGTNETKPCFSPVTLSGGPALTWYRPQDHPWHRALWFSWKYINGVSEDNFRGKAIGLDYAGLVENRGAGIAILDHPANLNSLTPWYAIREKVMHYFSPAVICYQPHTLKAGESMTLRYRLVVHPGHWDAERLRQEAARFAEQK